MAEGGDAAPIHGSLAPTDRLVLTANRRLARILVRRAHMQAAAEGRQAWATPAIQFWKDWVRRELVQDPSAGDLSVLADGLARVYWEEAVAGRSSGEAMQELVDLATSAQERLAQWQVSPETAAEYARTRDERWFIAVQRDVAAAFGKHGWLDPTAAGRIFIERAADGAFAFPRRVHFAGFVRPAPIVQSLAKVIESRGVSVSFAVAEKGAGRRSVLAFSDEASELRAAGAWARSLIESDPRCRPVVVVPDLADGVAGVVRCIREGLTPGWQSGQAVDAVDVSYGQPIAAYPAIRIATLCLQLAVSGLESAEMSILLRSPLVYGLSHSARAALDVTLRAEPARFWRAGELRAALQGTAGYAAGLDVFLGVAAELRDQDARRQSLSAWAIEFDRLLQVAGWPGEAPLDSEDFQLINRWRQLLNELSRYDAVLPQQSAADAVERLLRQAQATVYQPENPGGRIDVMGPLEAAGASFDYLWVARADADRWPPPERPHPLIARVLQRQLGMPDASPRETLQQASKVLAQLAGAAPQVRFSWARQDGDLSRALTPLLGDAAADNAEAVDAPGTHAAQLAGSATVETLTVDRRAAVRDGEIVTGGATTLALYPTEPFAAFARGRLGIRDLEPFRPGLSPRLRGTLAHAALQNLYRECPNASTIAGWSQGEREKRTTAAVNSALARVQSHGNPVLKRLIVLERQRLTDVLAAVIEHDCRRATFDIEGIETEWRWAADGLTFRLRADRLDRLADGRLLVIDYKTGKSPTLISRSGDPADLQLAVYATTLNQPVAGVAYLGIHRQGVEVKAIGDGIEWQAVAATRWSELLARFESAVTAAAAGIARGDVRVNPLADDRYSWPLAVLSRVTEIRAGD